MFLRFRKRRDLNRLQKSLASLAVAREFIDVTGPTREAQLINAAQSLTLMLYDCVVVFYDFQLAESGFQQRVYIRLFAVLAVDAIERFANPLDASGPELRDIALDAGINDPLGETRRKLESIKRNHLPFLKQVRNRVIAHRPKNAREEFETLASIDVAHALRAFQDILFWLGSLHLGLFRLLVTSAQLPPHVSEQIVSSTNIARS